MEYFNFLMDDLSSVFDELDDHSHCAHEVCICISVVGENVAETWYRLYTDHLKFDDKRFLSNAIAFFVGAGFLNIVCDCDAHDIETCEIYNINRMEAFRHGMEHCVNQTDEYENISSEIGSLKNLVFN